MGTEKKKKVGRPTKYDPSRNHEVEMFCKLGATDIELAELLGVCEDTIYEWKNKNDEFSESIKRGKVLADAKVAEALYNRATGAKVKETKVFSTENGLETMEVVKHYPPDTGAAALWLKNRRPKDWKDKQEVEHSITTFKVKSKKKK